MGELVVGANLPWLDFGASAWQPRGGLARPERREMRAFLAETAAVFRAREAGYAGALAWSALADDRATDARAWCGRPALPSLEA